MFFEKMQTRKNDGFTLVELIVVIAILAILAGIAVPAYSGYIEKANVAADEQLLHAVNIAFLSAAAEHADGTVSNASLSYGGSTGAVTVTGVASVTSSGTPDLDALKTAFATYYGENNTAAFKTLSNLVFDYGKQMFINPNTAESITLSYGDKGTVTISGVALAALKNSAFTTEMTPSELLNKVDYVTNLAATLMADPDSNSTFENLIKGPEYGQLLADSLKIQYGSQEFMTTVGAMLTEKMNLLIASGKYPEGSDTSEGSDLYNEAYNQIVANNAVINAAKNSSAVSDDILSVLGGTNSKGQIVTTINTNSGEGLSQAAMAYGLYTAYAERNNITVSDNPADVLLALDTDTNFKDYINNKDGNGYAQADLNGYLASMEMINNNTATNTDAVYDILINGFANEDLVKLLEGAVK